MTTPYIDPNLIFAENAPVQDKPAAFSNYDKGWDESRNNDGRPLIPQMNYLTQQADLKNLYIHKNGAALPYKEGIAYEENAVVVKDGVLQQWKGGVWKSAVESELADKADKTYVDTVRNESVRFYQTLAEANADIANIAVNQAVQVGESGENGGLWYKATEGATTLTKSAYDPLTQAKIYSDNLTRNYETKNIGTKNKFVVSDIIDGLYMNNSGAIRAAAGWGMSGAIPVAAGNYYTISGLRGSNGLAFYNTNQAVANVTNAIAGSYNGSVLPLTVQAPAGATFMRINLYSASNPTYSNIQVEDGQAVTKYEPNGVYFTLHEDAIVQTIGDNSITINDTTATLKGLLQDGSKIEIDLTLSKTPTPDQSNVFNFASIRRNGVTIVNNTDDAAPLHAEGTVIGANHGYAKSTLTVAGHTKTNADVGSVWSDGTKEWVIVAVLTDKIIITARSENLYYPTGGGTLTHVSGATNTSNIVSTASVNSQWHPVIKNRKLTMTIDGELSEIINKTVGFDDNVTFNESYDIMLKSDMVEWLIANGGVERTSYDAVGTMAVTQSYKFDKELGCIVSYNFTALRDVPKFSDIMVVQAGAMLGSNGLVKYYIPKSKDFVQNGVTYNFSNPTAISSLTLSSDILFNAAKNDDGANPVDHLIQLNDVIGFSIGFLPQADAAFDVRPTNCSRYYFQIFASSKKVYPRLIDRADLTSLTAGQSFSCTAYRKYFSKSAARTAKYVVDDYLYLDWHTATVDVIDTPPQFIGREFDVIEKSSNVQLNGGIASNRLIAKVDNTKNYGYAVLKFK